MVDHWQPLIECRPCIGNVAGQVLCVDGQARNSQSAYARGERYGSWYNQLLQTSLFNATC